MRDSTAALINYFKIKNLRRNISSNQRFNKIRLDKNEKTDYHSKLFFNKVIKNNII